MKLALDLWPMICNFDLGTLILGFAKIRHSMNIYAKDDENIPSFSKVTWETWLVCLQTYGFCPWIATFTFKPGKQKAMRDISQSWNFSDKLRFKSFYASMNSSLFKRHILVCTMTMTYRMTQILKPEIQKPVNTFSSYLRSFLIY